MYLALCGVSMLIATPVGGVLGDRFNKAAIMYVCDYLKGGMIILATVLMLLFRGANAHIAILFVLGILGNAVSGIFNPAAGSLFPHIIREEQLQQANSYISMKSALETILGIILAGILYAALRIQTLFFLVGACFVASGISEMLIRYEHKKSEEQLTLKVAVQDMREGLSYLKTKKAILALIVAVLFINFFSAPLMGNFLPYFIKTDLAGAPSYLFDKILTPELWSSVISVCFGITSLLGAAILSARPQEEKCGHKTALRLLAFAAIVVIVTIAYWILVDRGVSLNGFLITLSMCGLGIGFLIAFVNIPISTAIMRVVDRDKLSKVNSIMSFSSQGMTPIASMLAGVILENLGSTILLAVCAAGFTVTAVLTLLNHRLKEL